MATIPNIQTDAQVPAEAAAAYLRQHQVRADVTRSSLTASDPHDGVTATFSVYAGLVETAPVRAFLGY